MNLLSSFRPLLATATGTAVLVLLFAIDLQSQPSTSRQVTVTPSAADYAAAAAARNVKVHLRPANTQVGRKTSVAAISNSPAGPVTQNTAPDSGGPRFPADLHFHGGDLGGWIEHKALYIKPNECSSLSH